MSTSARPLELPEPTGDARLDAFARLFAIVDRLRAPDGCPWDREQTVDSMAPSLVEEAHEAVDAIERGKDEAVTEELGDVTMVVALIARIASEEGRFDAADIARVVGDKLIRRHPHVFADTSVEGSQHAVANWEKIKEAERREKREDASALAGLPRALPALQRASRVCEKAVAAGFRWKDAAGALAKLEEEVRELRQAFEDESRERIESELGDVLMAGGFLARYLELDPERATRAALDRFEDRFRRLEAAVGDQMRSASLEELMRAWEAAKEEAAEGR